MSAIKQIVDQLNKFLRGKNNFPIELLELNEYFRFNGPIHFEFKNEGNEIIAISKDFRHGSIVTSAKTMEELDENIKDAILTSFDLPSSYKAEAALLKKGEKEEEYAIA